MISISYGTYDISPKNHFLFPKLRFKLIEFHSKRVFVHFTSRPIFPSDGGSYEEMVTKHFFANKRSGIGGILFNGV